MKFYKYFLFLGIFIFLSSCKPTKDVVVNETPPPTVNKGLEKSLLWEISGNGLTESSYLLGTIHMIPKEDFFWPKGTLSALDASEQAIFEVDLDDMFDMGAQMKLMSKAFMKDDQKLSQFYSSEDFEFVKSHFKDMGIPMFLLEKIKPMFLTVFASGDIDMASGLGADSKIKSYEMELYDLCKDSDKEVSGLETLEFQISVFDSIPYQDQADMLLETIKSSNTEDDMFKEMIVMYKSQDIENMVESISDEENGLQGYEDILLTQRNAKWIPIMSQKMTEAKTFFAVGAGHLAGKDGVITLLKNAGYQLTPLSTNDNTTGVEKKL